MLRIVELMSKCAGTLCVEHETNFFADQELAVIMHSEGFPFFPLGKIAFRIDFTTKFGKSFFENFLSRKNLLFFGFVVL